MSSRGSSRRRRRGRAAPLARGGAPARERTLADGGGVARASSYCAARQFRILYPRTHLLTDPTQEQCMPRRNAVPARPARPRAKPARDAAAPAGGTVLPTRRQTLTGMTLDAVRERILRGQYPEGEPLRQDAIAEEL